MNADSLTTQPEMRATEEQVPFDCEELFFSRTDGHGVILAGNSVFQRVSQYSWNELNKKPHNVIRHPDMPKGVFWLLWDTIKRGDPVGAYVKNRAKDGRYYWVFAIITPVEGGYLSVRLKPSSDLFGVVAQEYKSLLAVVSGNKAGAKIGAEILLQRLAEFGFEDYASFMATALSREIATRTQRLDREPDVAIACFAELVTTAKSLMQQAQLISAAYAQSEYMPLNLQVQAAHLGLPGATIGAISNNYNLISMEIRSSIDHFIASATSLLKTINEGLFLLCTATIQSEVFDLFRLEISQSGELEKQDKSVEMRLLENQRKVYRQMAMSGLAAINDHAGRYRRDCSELKRLATRLEVTRIMGKMESARLTVIEGGLNELIYDLESFHTAITTGLMEIDIHNQNIQDSARRLIEIMKTRAS